MEVSGSTYDSALRGVFSQGRQQPERERPPAGLAPPAAVPAGGDRSGDQLGVRPGETDGREFRPYGPGSTVRGQDAGSPREGAAGATADGTPRAAEGGGTAEKPGADKGSAQDLQQQAEIARLRSTEEKVKAHEAAHKSAGGTMTGPVSYTYTRGPDGKQYITGGEVPITISAGRTPEETASKMQQVIRAALAPSDPSPQDRAVAAQAATQLQKAQQEAAAVSADGSTPASPGADTVAAAAEKAAKGDRAAAGGREAGPAAAGGSTGSAADPGIAATPAAVADISPEQTPTARSAPRADEAPSGQGQPERDRRNRVEREPVDGVSAAASRRAYANPAVTGQDQLLAAQYETTGTTPSDRFGRAAGSILVAPQATAAQISGFGAPRPLSYYA